MLSELRREYHDKCALDDAEARKRVNDDQTKVQQAERDRRVAVQEGRAAVVQSRERCTAMRDTIALKRKREATLNEAEVASLRQFEGTYNAQCLGR